MSRTEGINLPRLPTSHARLTSPQSMSVHPAVNRPPGTAGANATNVSKLGTRQHRRSVSEPSYTAYLGTPRQDIPRHVYHDAAMFDDVFEKQGKLFHSRDTPKITNPLNSLGYSSLHDPHCRKLFLNNKALRSHLMDLGLITDDLKVVASTHEQRQKIRAHELLERKETLLYKLEMQEQQRIERLQRGPKQLPPRYRESILKAEERRERAEVVKNMKVDKAIQAQEKMKSLAEKKRLLEKKKMQQAIEEARLFEQAKRNAARYRQETAELAAYERQYGKMGRQLALWHRDSDRIHNRMIVMERRHWSKGKKSIRTHLPEATTSDQHSVKSPTSDSAPAPPSTDDQVTAQEQVSQPATDQDVSSSGEQIVNTVHTSEDTEATVAQAELSDQPDEPIQGEATEESGTPKDTPSTAEESHGTKEVTVDVQSEDKVTKPEGETVASAMELLDREESDAQLVSIIVDALRRVDHQSLGFVSIDDFTQLLNSRDLGLQLNENEILYIAEQANAGNGWVPFIPVTQQLPNLLVAMYNQRAEIQMQKYGGYMEDQWCEMYLPSNVVYYNKLTGQLLTGGRPEDFRPYLKEDPFEESIVDFFETADTDKDGVIDINNFYSLLMSPMVSTHIYSNQMEDLLTLFQENSDEGLATLEIFVPIAKNLLVMVYQNAYPDVEEWIELESRKLGTFLFNKETGETYLPGQPAEATQTEEATEVKTTPKKKKHKKKKPQAPTDSTPPEISNDEKLTGLTRDPNSETVQDTIPQDQQETTSNTSIPTLQSSGKEIPKTAGAQSQDQEHSTRPTRTEGTSNQPPDDEQKPADEEKQPSDDGMNSKAETSSHQELQENAETENHPKPDPGHDESSAEETLPVGSESSSQQQPPAQQEPDGKPEESKHESSEMEAETETEANNSPPRGEKDEQTNSMEPHEPSQQLPSS